MHYNELKRIFDKFESEHATVCDEDGRRFKVVIDGLLYYADEPRKDRRSCYRRVL